MDEGWGAWDGAAGGSLEPSIEEIDILGRDDDRLDSDGKSRPEPLAGPWLNDGGGPEEWWLGGGCR